MKTNSQEPKMTKAIFGVYMQKYYSTELHAGKEWRISYKMDDNPADLLTKHLEKGCNRTKLRQTLLSHLYGR